MTPSTGHPQYADYKSRHSRLSPPSNDPSCRDKGYMFLLATKDGQRSVPHCQWQRHHCSGLSTISSRHLLHKGMSKTRPHSCACLRISNCGTGDPAGVASTDRASDSPSTDCPDYPQRGPRRLWYSDQGKHSDRHTS